MVVLLVPPAVMKMIGSSIEGLELLGRLQAGAFRQHDVQEDDVGRGLSEFEPFVHRLGGEDVETRALKSAFDRETD